MVDQTLQAKGLYDFDGDVDNGELSFQAGEIITITAQDIGEGWWEACNDSGQSGLIPEAYVQLLEPPEPSFPPPPPPAAVVSTDNAWDNRQSTFSDPSSGYSDTNGYEYANQNTGGYTGGGMMTQESEEAWDSDWGEDDDDQSSNSTATTNPELKGGGNFGLSAPNREGKQTSNHSEMSRYGTVKKNFNRFSTFAKAGGEAYLMGTVSANVSESDLIRIIESNDGPEWYQASSPYTCSIKSPKKESKLKGLKSFMSYQLTPSFSNIQVSRRYKHFDWLHERLEEKFTCIPIPPLPDKALAGRYEDDFVAERMRYLQLWMDRMVRHPVISQSEVINHFLTCTDEKKWKTGKRKAEKDEYQGGKFFLTLQTPPTPLVMRDVEKKMELFCKFVKNMDENVRHSLNVMHDNRKKHLGPYKREFQKIGGSFKQLAATFNMDTASYSQSLTAAIDYAGDTYNEIGDLFEKQPKEDIDPVMETLHEYKGILSTYPDVLKVHEGAVGKAKECEKLKDEGRMPESDVQAVIQRSDVISYGTLAQMSHFQRERVADFKHTMQTYLQGQIKFYKEITQKMENALQRFDNA